MSIKIGGDTFRTRKVTYGIYDDNVEAHYENHIVNPPDAIHGRTNHPNPHPPDQNGPSSVFRMNSLLAAHMGAWRLRQRDTQHNPPLNTPFGHQQSMFDRYRHTSQITPNARGGPRVSILDSSPKPRIIRNLDADMYGIREEKGSSTPLNESISSLRESIKKTKETIQRANEQSDDFKRRHANKLKDLGPILPGGKRRTSRTVYG